MRFLSVISATAFAFGASEIEACTPFVKKALDELPADLRSGDPATALLATAKEAGSAMITAGFANVSLTGLLGAAAHAFFSNSLAAPTTAPTMVAPPSAASG